MPGLSTPGALELLGAEVGDAGEAGAPRGCTGPVGVGHSGSAVGATVTGSTVRATVTSGTIGTTVTSGAIGTAVTGAVLLIIVGLLLLTGAWDALTQWLQTRLLSDMEVFI